MKKLLLYYMFSLGIFLFLVPLIALISLYALGHTSPYYLMVFFGELLTAPPAITLIQYSTDELREGY